MICSAGIRTSQEMMDSLREPLGCPVKADVQDVASGGVPQLQGKARSAAAAGHCLRGC